MSLRKVAAFVWCAAGTLAAQSIVYKPYIQLGDAPGFGPKDQMVVAWQTDEKTPP
jgi:hypothetical protein